MISHGSIPFAKARPRGEAIDSVPHLLDAATISGPAGALSAGVGQLRLLTIVYYQSRGTLPRNAEICQDEPVGWRWDEAHSH
ncbi:hypothetical protein [Gimesia chilikensis]|uniref:hypothetical protein n=1 Tax=Gimesia chilikensis TaxID=2605989 RepID=UPI0011A687DF|nr:hypothetical protein [Gimesia chilikensis]